MFVNHYGSTEVYTFSIGRDQGAKPGCAGRPAVNTRLKLEPDGEICAHLSSDEAFGGYWNRPDADARRSATAGTTRATPAISTTTATSGSTAGSTT